MGSRYNLCPEIDSPDDPGFDVPEGAQLWESPKKSGKKTSNFLKSVLADSDVPENQLVSDFGSSRKLEAVIGQSGDDNIYGMTSC